MNLPLPSKDSHGVLRRWAWLLTLAAVLVLVAILARSPGASKIALDIRLNKNGIATVLGIPLGSGSVRDVTFQMLSKGHVPVRVLIPSGIIGAPGWDTNVSQTMGAITRAQLIPTNKPSGPSPYE